MNIKIECSCGTRYSFDVEPREGRMPFTVECPSCHADGTEAANKIIAQTPPAVESPTRLRIQSAPDSPHAPQPAAPPEPAASICKRHPGKVTVDHCVACGKPICPDCMAAFGYLCSVACRYDAEKRGISVPVFEGQTRLLERRSLNKGTWLTAAVVAVLIAIPAVCIWYYFVGSRPHLAASFKMPGSTAINVGFLGPNKILAVNAQEATLLDGSLNRAIWTTSLSDKSSSEAPAPQAFIGKGEIWICLRDQVRCLDPSNGSVKYTIPISGRFLSFTPSDNSLLVVSEQDETRRTAMHIDLATGAPTSQEIVLPRGQKQNLPDELPPNVQPTAAVLLDQALDQKKFGKPLDAMSSEFYSAGEFPVEMRVKLLEANVVYEKSIKPRGPSVLNGKTTAGSDYKPIGEELLNDLKRSETGGVRRVDESRYEVTLRRWTSAQPVEWKGDVTGPPAFFPLATVDVLVAGKAMTVFDKQNKVLFDSKLNYPTAAAFTTGNLAGHISPAVEHDGRLYFFDQGTLTVFDLPSGQVRWQLTSFGISSIQFDDKGMLYIDSTAASADDIKYSDTIHFKAIPGVLIKADAATGNIIWKVQNDGQQTLVAGKFLYAASLHSGGPGFAVGLREALNQPATEGPYYFYVYRIDPDTGKTMWNLYRNAKPEGLAVNGNRILLIFDGELQLFKYLTF